MLYDCHQFNDVDTLRLGRLERIHVDLHRFSDDSLTRDITSADELDKFYASKVLCPNQYFLLFRFLVIIMLTTMTLMMMLLEKADWQFMKRKRDIHR